MEAKGRGRTEGRTGAHRRGDRRGFDRLGFGIRQRPVKRNAPSTHQPIPLTFPPPPLFILSPTRTHLPNIHKNHPVPLHVPRQLSDPLCKLPRSLLAPIRLVRPLRLHPPQRLRHGRGEEKLWCGGREEGEDGAEVGEVEGERDELTGGGGGKTGVVGSIPT
jgi:hypothetical protein